MKKEKLQSLLYSFIEYKQSCDTVDGNITQDAAVGYDNPLTSQGSDFAFPYGEPPITPLSPLQFSPFAPVTPTQSNTCRIIGRTLVEAAATFSSFHPDQSNIKFEKFWQVVTPEEKIISISVIRSGGCSNLVQKISWKTCDKTAFSGKHYIGSSGELVFNDGEIKKEIQIQILKYKDDANDLRFKVELSDDAGVFTPKPLTISLKNINQFYDDERQVIDNLPESSSFSIYDIRSALSDSLTSRTFHMALSHLCSTEDSVLVQLALAFELSQLCLKNIKEESLMFVLTDFFRMDEIDF